MRAITLHERDIRFCDNWPEPELQSGEVPIRVSLAGICETDLQLAKGYMGFAGVLGHEFVGVALAGKHIGKRVVGEINCSCQKCERCANGLGNHCADRTVIGIDQHHGAFADIVAVPERNLHLIPNRVTNEQAVFIEPLAAALQVTEQVTIGKDDRVLICGDGRLALMSANALMMTGASVNVIGKHEQKLNRFKSLNIESQLLEDAEPHDDYDVVIDCTGSPTGLRLALNQVRPRGTVVMKTTVASNHVLSFAKVVIDEITLIGSRCGPFAKAVDALSRNAVNVDSLITHRFPIESGVEAFQVATDPAALKVVLDLGR